MDNINRVMINKMLDVMRAKADATWKAMYGTHQYKHLMMTLAKSDEDITYVDKEFIGSDLRVLCMCLGIRYYSLIKEVCA